jgi:putative oxidoreductase
MNFALLVLRTVIGLLFIGHGTQKLYGWFGGHGPHGTASMFEKLGLRPGERHARAAGVTEAVGGALLILGLLTPAAAAMLIAVMVTAIWTVHGPKGPWITDGGYEYNIVLIAAAFAIAAFDAGSWSLDNAFGLSLTGAGWAIAALAAGVAGGAGAVWSGRATAQRERREAVQRRTHGGPPHPAGV